jgi:hypothetical protein
MSDEQEVNELLELLTVEDLVPHLAITGFEHFTDEAKNEVVNRLASRLEPPPSGHLLARLQLILTEDNRQQVVTAYLANLRSPEPGARQASLRGLAELRYPGVADLALASLRDDADQVVATACDILLPEAADDPALRGILTDVYAAHRDDAAFHVTTAILAAHGIGA